MLKMRTVPDDFDNVQALHSPYGAVHGNGTPMHSPLDYLPNYSDHRGLHPMSVDIMDRHHGDEHISPTGITPSFNHVGFGPPGSMGTSDILSPLSLNSGDRYYGNNLSSPLGNGPRSSNPFNRQNSSDNYQLHAQQQSHNRSLQPLPLRDTISRSRSESLQSPLRTSMSWKGDSLNYGGYPRIQSPTIDGRPQTVYQHEQPGDNHATDNHYDTNSYTGECFTTKI